LPAIIVPTRQRTWPGPPNVKVLHLPCTGKVDVLYLLRAFEKGADAVFVAG
jgi:coenzyme F420-reducing hydrogenase delta subunit